MSANERQVGGDHYKGAIQHWDWVIANDLSYMQGQITKYVARYKKKNGLQDLEKARHFLDKLIEVEQAELKELARLQELARRKFADEMHAGFERAKKPTPEEAGPEYVDQDPSAP